MPTAPGFANVAIQFLHAGLSRPAYLTFGVDPTSADPQAIASLVADTADDPGSLTSIMDAETTMSEVRVSLGTDGTVDIVGGITTTVVGGLSVSALPANCAVLVHKRTARGGRRGRGRLFIPWCVSETNTDEAGIITTANVTTLQTAMNTWKANMTAAQIPMYLLHDPSAPGTVHPSAPGAPDLVTALTVDKLISTQRRRLGRR